MEETDGLRRFAEGMPARDERLRPWACPPGPGGGGEDIATPTVALTMVNAVVSTTALEARPWKQQFLCQVNPSITDPA